MTATAPADAPTVRIASVTVAYRRRGRRLRVLDDVSLDIRPGEAYGLVGESGCGKTTLALTLMRYLPRNAVIEQGRIDFAGADLLALDDAQLQRLRGERMAMVSQNPGSALNPTLRTGDQIAEIYRQHRGLGRADALAQAAGMLELVHVSDVARVLRRYPHELSGGQQQRVMIAMALATDPDLLVLDEPTTGLDATIEAEVLDLVAQLRDRFNAAILFVSHNLAIVSRMCERIGVLYAGRLIEQGPARELLADPRHPYTLGLVRCLPRLGMRKDVDRLEPIPGSLPPLGAELPGCVYAERCPIAVDRCRVEEPELELAGARRLSRCFFHADVPSIPPRSKPRPASVATAETHTGAPLLELRGVVKAYHGNVVAVAGVDLAVAPGEVLGLVGESGSGKTTLAHCVVGLTDASAGDILLRGGTLSARRTRAQRSDLQIVFQNPDTALNPRWSVRRILARSLRRLEGGAPGGRLTELTASVRLEPRHLELKPAALSGGLKQRVAIGRALAGGPALVLCDEPTSALDVSVQAAILNLLVDLQSERDLAYVFITHDLAVVRYVADQIAVMYLGQIVDVGPAQQVFAAPHHPYTEALLSASPSLDPGVRARISLRGPIPRPSDPPSGCRFHSRCHRNLGDVCATEPPPWQQGGDGHRYRCHIPPSELSELQHD